jgi:hypothetical protein
MEDVWPWAVPPSGGDSFARPVAMARRVLAGTAGSGRTGILEESAIVTRLIYAALTLVIGLAGCAPKREVVVVERPRREFVERQARPGWTMLGERTVEGNYDHDTIQVGASEGRFNRIMFAVEHHAVEIFDVKIVFGDGSTFDVPTRLVFHAESRSQVVDLPGADRVIRRVDFKYGNVAGRGQAHVEVWAR